MTKKVKITVNGLPIISISTPLTMGTHGPVIMDIKDIFKCIIAGAKVTEVFDGYGEVVLTLSNYNSDNTPYVKADVVKTVMDDMQEPEERSIEPATSDADESQSDSEEPVPSDGVVRESIVDVIPEYLRRIEAAISDTTTEEVVVESAEGVQTKVEPKSPEHWMPPQRNNNQGKNNNKNKNKGR